jgi:hypothetical protein
VIDESSEFGARVAVITRATSPVVENVTSLRLGHLTAGDLHLDTATLGRFFSQNSRTTPATTEADLSERRRGALLSLTLRAPVRAPWQ